MMLGHAEPALLCNVSLSIGSIPSTDYVALNGLLGDRSLHVAHWAVLALLAPLILSSLCLHEILNMHTD